MSYNSPAIPVLSAPEGLEVVIESIREVLDDNILWLDKSFGRAWTFKEKDAQGKTRRVPKIYVGSKEYLNVLPNDFLVSQSFIVAHNPESWEVFNRFEGSIKTRELSLIFWVNLLEINPAKDQIFTESLKADIEDIIKRHPSVKAIDSYYDEKVEDIFEGFDVTEDSQYLMYPYAGMRFDILVNYDEKCLSTPEVSFIYPAQNSTDIEFTVGAEGLGEDLIGETTFQNDELKGYRVRIHRNSIKQSKIPTVGGYSFSQSAEDISLGQFGVLPAFVNGEIIIIEKY